MTTDSVTLADRILAYTAELEARMIELRRADAGFWRLTETEALREERAWQERRRRELGVPPRH